ncbi:MAG: hypothetical protein KJ630_19020 [Proteobacteria bacterium]|nr:hypothetical protein [Pseudomonadota bacterium]
MKFYTRWDGIDIVADDKDDDKILSSLIMSLPEDAERPYEEGDVSLTKYNGRFVVSFNR